MAFWDSINRVNSLTVYNVQDYGAKNFAETADSSPAVRSAISAAVANGGGAIYFPALRTPGGYYQLDKDPTKTASINIENITVPLVFYGDGAASRLVFAGAGNGGAWSMFKVRASSSIKFLNLHMEMGFIANPDPNFGADPHHLIQLSNNGVPTASIENIEIAGCTFRWTRGDQVSLLCEDTEDDLRTRVVWIHHNYFNGTSTFGFLDGADDPVGCRSCVQVQRNVESIWVTDNYMTGCAKAMIDFEPTGVGPVGSFKVDRNILVNAPPNGIDGSSSVSISGNGSTDPNTYSSFCDNILLHGGVQTRMLDRCTISRNVIIDDRIHANPTLNLNGLVHSCRVSDNYIRRHSTVSSLQPVVLIQHGGSGGNADVPSEVRVENNDLIQEKYASVVFLEGVTGTTIVRNNRLYYNGPDYVASDGDPETLEDGNVFHLLARSQGKTPASDIEVDGNIFAGTGLTRACVQISADLGNLGDAVVHDNTLRQAGVGLEMNRSSTHTVASLSLQGNRNYCATFWSSPGGQTFHPIIGGNKGSVCTFETGATPEGVIAAPVGSLAVNKAGDASTTLYVKTSGTGNTGWTAK